VVSEVVEGPRGLDPAVPTELDQVIALVDAAMRKGSDQTMRSDYPLVYAPSNLVNVQAVFVDEVARATAPVLPKRVVGDGIDVGLGIISPTATDPPFQHRRYGARCVAACVGRMSAMDLPLSALWTMVATFPFYELNGWQAVERFGGAYPLTRVEAERFPAWSGRVIALRDAPDRLGEVLALHDAAGDRIERTREQAAALFALPKMSTWLALAADGSVAGYLLDSRAINKPGLLEAAGDPMAIEGLIRAVLDGLADGATIDLQVGYAPDPLPSIATARLGDRAVVPSSGNMMLRLNDPLGFLRGVRGWLAANRPADARSVSIRVTDADQTIGFEWRASGMSIGTRELDEHVELTRRELASVLFGPHPDRPFEVPAALAWLPPFHVPIPVLDRS
jgi:hypothetical protein